MSLEELEAQLLSLSPVDRLRLMQSVLQSLMPNLSAQPSEGDDLMHDRSPNHPLRHMPLVIPPDFDAPMTDLWDALEQ